MPPSPQPYISKSTFLMGRQCSKLLWFRYKAKDQIPAPDEATQAVFDQGTEVGDIAQQLFPGGMVVAPDFSHEFLRVTYGQVSDAERRRVPPEFGGLPRPRHAGYGSDRGPAQTAVKIALIY